MFQHISKWAPWDLTQFSQSPSAALSYFPESYQQSEISSLSKVILVLGKAKCCRVQKNSAGDMMQDWLHCRDEVASHQLPIAAAVFIVLHLSINKEHSGNTPY